MSKKLKLRLLVLFIPIVAIAIFLFLKYPIRRFAELLPNCIFHSVTGYACPACGNTRSILYLLDGKLFMSLRYNIVPGFIFLLIICFYAELLFAAFFRPIKIVPRNNAFLFSVIGFFVFYFIIRNFI